MVPSGVGAAVGGFAGDATPATNLLAGVADLLLAHPNAVNAAGWMAAGPRVWYVDGYWLDEFMQGRCGLAPARANRVGVLIDRAAEPWLPQLLDAVEAARAVLGLAVSGWTFTDTAVGGRAVPAASGGYQGRVDGAAALLRAGAALAAGGAEALAVFTVIPELPEAAVAAYERGEGPDPLGGVEAALSRLLAAELRLPVAHAPVFPPDDGAAAGRVDPRVAAEAAFGTYAPCVLQGLQRAPRPSLAPQALAVESVAALVAPVDALGGPAAFAARARGIPIVAVRQNRTALAVTAASLGWETGVWEVENYLEAAGLLLAWREGLDPASVLRPFASMPPRAPA